MNRWFLLLVFLLFVFCSEISSTALIEQPYSSSGEIHYVMDSSTFYSTGGNPREEIYFRFGYDQLSFIKQVESEKLKGEYRVELTLFSGENEQPVKDKISWQAIVLATEKQLQPEEGMMVFDQTGIDDIKPGVYRLKAVIEDITNSRKGECESFFEAEPVAGSEVFMSDIQFAWRIVPSEQPGKFLKSKNIVVPHPPRIYSAQNPMVYIYTEIYSETGEPQDLLYKIAVNDPLGNEVKNYPSSVENIQGKMIAYSKVINVASLKSNYYWLDIKLEKPDGTCVCEKRGLFQFKKIATDLISPDFYIIGLNSQELADYDGRFLKYFALKKDRDKYNELKNDSSKRLFIQDFWNNMAKNKGDDPVELRVKILNRYAYANNNYKYSNVDGWKSDRGRIYILYGPPADIEQVVFETTSAAREIWTLVIDGRLETFIFEDRAGNGQYELVDTTNKGEKGVIKYQGYQPTM